MALTSHDGSPDPRVEPHPGRIEDAVVDSRPSREALEGELVRVHDELTHLLTGSLAADRRPEALGVDRPGGLEGAFDRHWRKIRRELGSVYRDYRAGRASTGSALKRATRIGLKHGVLAPRDALAEFLRLRDEAVGPTLAGAGPMTMLPGELDSERARIWLSVLERHYPSGPARTAYFEQLRRLALRDGQISTALDATAELASSNTSMARAAVDVNGRMTELSGWLPRLPGPVEAVSGCGTNVVLHLLKESRPYLSNGFTSRTQWNLLAEKDAGWTPVVLTEPGFPEGLTEGRPSTVEEVDGIEHRRILTGASYRGVPFDRWLEDFAFLALDHVRNVRPDVLHVSSGRRGYETALVGLALREKTGLPLVYEVRSFFEGNWTPDLDIEERSEVFRRRREVETRCMIAADRVLTLGEAMKEEIAESRRRKWTSSPTGCNWTGSLPRLATRRLRLAMGSLCPPSATCRIWTIPAKATNYSSGRPCCCKSGASRRSACSWAVVGGSTSCGRSHGSWESRIEWSSRDPSITRKSRLSMDSSMCSSCHGSMNARHATSRRSSRSRRWLFGVRWWCPTCPHSVRSSRHPGVASPSQSAT